MARIHEAAVRDQLKNRIKELEANLKKAYVEISLVQIQLKNLELEEDIKVYRDCAADRLREWETCFGKLEACEKHCEILNKSNDELATKYHERQTESDAYADAMSSALFRWEPAAAQLEAAEATIKELKADNKQLVGALEAGGATIVEVHKLGKINKLKATIKELEATINRVSELPDDWYERLLSAEVLTASDCITELKSAL